MHCIFGGTNTPTNIQYPFGARFRDSGMSLAPKDIPRELMGKFQDKFNLTPSIMAFSQNILWFVAFYPYLDSYWLITGLYEFPSIIPLMLILLR